MSDLTPGRYALLHTSDLHLTEGSRRFPEHLGIFDAIVDEGIARQVSAWCVPGDYFGTKVPYRSTIVERNALAMRLRRMADYAPVFGCYGNHDFPGDLDIFELIEGRHPIIMASRPLVQTVGDFRVYFLPYPSKRWVMADGGIATRIDDQNAMMVDGLRQVLAAWRSDAEHAREMGLVPIGIMHVNIGGSHTAGGEVLIGQEIELAPHDLDELGLSYIALGHIHKAQRMATAAYYSGNPWGENFGEPGTKSFQVASVDEGGLAFLEVVPTSSRPVVTLTAVYDHDTGHVRLPEHPSVVNADVRVKVAIPQEVWATCDVDRLRMDLPDAASVDIRRTMIPTERVRCEAIRTATTTAERLRAWFTSLGDDAPETARQDRALAKLAMLEAEEG